MAIKIDTKLTPQKLAGKLNCVFELSAQKILSIEKNWQPSRGTPVFTVKGQYTSRGWTEWTQGFEFGSALLQYDATGEQKFLELGRSKTAELMASHITHTGVHDHGFNNVSTYGNLLRLMREKKIPHHLCEEEFYELALKLSGAVQANRWSSLAEGGGFIYSFNGPHSLFVDTVRSLRVLAIAHSLGHVLMGEQDRKISLLERLVQHADATARYSVYHGKGRDAYDVRGRVAHECIFNTNNGGFRCPNSQQGYSPFSTWTRGLAWALCGFAEQLEYLQTVPDAQLRSLGGRARFEKNWLESARDTADFYLANCCTDGIPMWDTGAPNLHKLGDYLSKPADPFNAWEPVDSSAAAIAAQGLYRLGNYLMDQGDKVQGGQYRQAALTITNTLVDTPYLSLDAKHQGLLLHSVYHRPNGWDYIAPGQKIPNGESSMWGDYHLRELALLVLREAKGGPYLTFFGCLPRGR
ncbi:MAG: glycosyl hydrolase [Verrucomicrobiota bacterium]